MREYRVVDGVGNRISVHRPDAAGRLTRVSVGRAEAADTVATPLMPGFARPLADCFR